MTKDAGKTLLFMLAVGLGVMLAWGFYAALRPSVEVIMQPIERQQQHADSLARAQAAQRRQHRADSLARALAPVAAPAGPAALPAPGPPTAETRRQAATGSTRPARRATHLLATPAAAGQGRWALLAGLGLAAAAAAWALWEARQRLPLPIPMSRVLEALLTLKPHQELLKKCLSPRQIKRFNSKARVQHRQLTALAQHTAGFRFPVEEQLVAFQALLLLEEDREGPQRLLRASQSEFVAHLEQACAARTDLTTARQLARQCTDIAAAVAREASAPVALTPAQRRQLLARLYELNAGLLA